jgi:filamentous hemagglutinin family protein
LLLSAWLASSQAQVQTAIRPDGTLGTAVTQTGSLYEITGGTRPGNGPNLFHSFDRFRIGTGDTARFTGPTGIENILSRVTCGEQSIIDGRLQSAIPGANFYLLNPSGVLFGPNASLDVSGSFHVSTADYLRLGDGGIFSANLSEKSTLTVAPPIAFGFLRENPAEISMQGSSLQVPIGQTLSLIGGDITVQGGSLMAPSGRINLASVASPGTVTFSPSLNLEGFGRLGKIDLSDFSVVDASGDGGGTVVVRGGRLFAVNQSGIAANTLGNTNGAEVALTLL